MFTSSAPAILTVSDIYDEADASQQGSCPAILWQPARSIRLRLNAARLRLRRAHSNHATRIKSQGVDAVVPHQWR